MHPGCLDNKAGFVERETFMRSPKQFLAVFALLLLPATAFAQATLTGTVRDASGGVLPGVTVEASSPALIEKVRSAVTDDTGQFRIIDLRPGLYTLTVTLPGFVTVRRADIQLSGSQTLTLPIEMKVGGLEESITVTGETPVVDVQSVRREVVLDADVIQSIPATRAVGALLNATPGVNVSDAGLALSPTMTSFNARSSTINAGSVGGEGRYTVNGMTVSASRSGGHSSYVYDTVNTDEVAITVGGGLGETDIGGPVMNIVPRSGGNTFSGSAFTSLAGDWSRGDNLSDDIRALNPNLQQTPGIINAYDSSVSFGGPIMRDRLWFYGSFRDLSTQTAMEGINANANAGDPSRWDWVGAPIEARLVQDRRMVIGRMTGQFGQHRLRFNSEYQHRCEGTPLRVETDGCHNRGEDWIGLGNNTGTQMSPEATSTAGRGYFDVPFYVNQIAWTMPASNKLLLEAGFSAFRYQPIFGHPAPDGITNLTPVTEQSNAINPATQLRYAPVANYRYRGVESWGPAHGHNNGVTASASYVTGAHSSKFGYQFNTLDLLDKDVPNSTQLGYRFNQGVPNAVSYYLPPFGRRTVTVLHGLYVQDSWTIDRLTLQGALRYDRANSFAPVDLNGTTETSFLNPTPIIIEKTKGVDAYHDITPRVGVAYDVFGTGRTAIKFNWGRYLAYAANDSPYTSTNPGATVVRNVMNRGWNASVAAGGNGDLVVNCDLLNPNANGECAALTGNARNFGQLGAQQVVNPDVLHGLGPPAARLSDDHHAAAGAVPARLGGGELRASHVAQLLRDRRSDASERRRRVVLRHLHADGAAGSASGRWRQLPDYRLRADRRRRQRGGAELPDARNRLRPGARQPLGRRRLHGQCAAAQRPDGAGGHEHGSRCGEHLRDGDELQPGHHRAEPARLRQRRAMDDDAARSRELHDSQGGRTGQRHVPLAAPGGDHRHVAGAEFGDRGGARPPARRVDADGEHEHPAHRQRAPRLRRGAEDAGRHAAGEDSPLRSHPYRRRYRRLQPAEHELPHGVQHDLHLRHGQHAASEWMGHADEHLHAAVRAAELHGEFLTGSGIRDPGLDRPSPGSRVPECRNPRARRRVLPSRS